MKKKLLRLEEEIDRETGEIKRTKHEVQFDAEPAFIKLYLDCLGMFTRSSALDKNLNDMLIATLKYMTYADKEQIIYLNSTIKKRIAESTGKSIARYNQALTLWVKEGILRRIDRGAYQVNPWVFGKGDWRDIEQLRATFSFGTGTVTVETDRANHTDPETQNDAPEPSESVTEAFKEPTCEDDEPLLFPKHEVAAAAAMTTDDIRQRYGL